MKERKKVNSPFFFCWRINEVLDARDGDQTTRLYQFREQLDHVCHGLVYHPTVYPRVEVICGPFNIDAKVGDASDAISCRGTIGREPVNVRLFRPNISDYQMDKIQLKQHPEILTIQAQSTPAK